MLTVILINGVVAGRVLDLLTRYRFLTIAQFVACGAGDERTVRRRLQELITARVVARQEFRLGPGVGRLPSSHWLTPKGAEFLSDVDGVEIVAPTSRVIQPSHAWHRMLTVDALIAADRWADSADMNRPTVRTYMQRNGRNSVTDIAIEGKNAIADAILETRDGEGSRRLYILEVYCSQYSEGRSMFPVEQLEPYILSGMTDSLEENLALEKNDKAVRVLVVCDTPELKARLLRTLPKREGMPSVTNRTWQRFLFKSADEIADFRNGWQRIDGSTSDLPT